MALVVDGNLKRPVHGGTVRAKLQLVKPAGLSLTSHFKYMAATAFTRQRSFNEPLCEHLGLPEVKGGCSLQPGVQQMKLSFGRMPEVVFVGRYTMQIEVVDEEGRPVTCARGNLTVQPGASKGVLRKLEAGCPDLIMENLWAIESFATDECPGESPQEGYRTTGFNMNGRHGFHMRGHWWEECLNKDNEPDTLHLYKRTDQYEAVFWKPCNSTKFCNQTCGPNECQDLTCRPTGENRCEELRVYHGIRPENLVEHCKEGGSTVGSGGVASSAPSGLASVGSPLLVTAALFAAVAASHL